MTSQQSGQSAPSAPDVLVTSNVQKYAMKKKKILNPEESELFELTQAAGITIDQEIFKIIVDLLKMNVAPQAVFQTLKSMCAGQRIADTSLGDSITTSHTTSLTTAPAEHREDDSAVSGKSAKPPAPPPSSSGTTTRPTRVNAKIAVYGPQDAHSQVRSKAGAGHSDKSLNREGSSSQKVQRQPSATRGQKTKSSGSSSSSSTQITST